MSLNLSIGREDLLVYEHSRQSNGYFQGSHVNQFTLPEVCTASPVNKPRVFLITSRDLVKVTGSAVNIRVGAVGLWQENTGHVFFRRRDICSNPTNRSPNLIKFNISDVLDVPVDQYGFSNLFNIEEAL